jgi:hypothetical protein
MKSCEKEKMMFNKSLRAVMLFTVLLSLSSLCAAQSSNLLLNPNADLGAQSWRAFGKASVETTEVNNFCFVVRDGGYFLQDVELPDNAAGQYALLIGRAASERINADGAITGLPYLYGYMMESDRPGTGHILDYLQGQQMLARPQVQGQWVNVYGIFKVPEKTKRIRFFLNQALRNGVPHNGSAARFDNLGLYLFLTREEAEAYLPF